MESLKIKHRTFEIVESVSKDTFIGVRKNKKYFIRQFTPKTQESMELTYAMRKISTSGVKSPKLYWIDEKNGYAVSEYLEGENMCEYLSKNDMDDKLFEQLFLAAYLAKINRMTLDYSPDKWMNVSGTLYYIYPMFIIYQKEKDLVDRYMKLWFNTKELAKFMNEKGIFYDKSRVKDEYSANKEMVLTICKYYR